MNSDNKNEMESHNGQDVSIIFTGDVSLNNKLEQLMIYNCQEFFDEDLVDIFKEANYRIFNLESVLSKSEERASKAGPNLKSDPRTINAIKHLNFNLACLANNHILDFGENALIDTIKILEKNNISYTGITSADKKEYSFILEINSIKFGIINFAEADESAKSKDKIGANDLSPSLIKREIKNVKNKVDFIVIILHAGREYVQIPSPRIYNFYKELIDFGAHLVIGHHPHEYQGIKIYKNSIIAYSLGNFIFSSSKKLSKKHPQVNKGFFLRISFNKEKIINYEIFPYKISENRIELLRNKEKDDFDENMENITRILDSPLEIEKFWRAYYKKLKDSTYFPYFAGALLNSISKGKPLKRIKIVVLTILWMMKNWKNDKSVFNALNHIKNPTHRELYINTLENIIKDEFE